MLENPFTWPLGPASQCIEMTEGMLSAYTKIKGLQTPESKTPYWEYGSPIGKVCWYYLVEIFVPELGLNSAGSTLKALE